MAVPFAQCLVFVFCLAMAVASVASGVEDRRPVATDVATENLEVLELFRAPDPECDACLDALIEERRALVALLADPDNGWLADSISGVVKMAPFDARRRKGFDCTLDMATTLLEDKETGLDYRAVVLMPAKSLFLWEAPFRVTPSYGTGRIVDFARKLQQHPTYDVRSAVTDMLGVVATVDRELVSKCASFLKEQIDIEAALGRSEGIPDEEVHRRIRFVQDRLEWCDSILSHGWEPASIPDTSYRRLKLMSREELVDAVGKGYEPAARMLAGIVLTSEEREVILASASRSLANSASTSGGLLRLLCTPIRRDLPRSEELARVDQVIAWFERELEPSELHPFVQQTFLRQLNELAGGLPRKTVAEDFPHLDQGRVNKIISLMERCLDTDKCKRLAATYIERLRTAYELPEADR